MKQLIDDINAAFANLEPPTDDKLLHPDCRDDVDILDFYGGLRREDMTDRHVIYNYAAFNSFSAAAFQYYLPRFMVWTLENHDSIEYAAESLLLALDPGTDREMLHDFRKSKFALLTKPQIDVVKRFLWHLSGHDDLGQFADTALVNYWIEQD
jgi:hypothetical protein